MANLNLIGFGPDLDPTTPGVLTDCDNLLPSTKGFKGAPAAVTVGLPALSAEVRGLVVAEKLDSTKRTFAATSTAIFEASGTTWIDQSKVGGYTLDAENRWRFAQFGDVTLATKKDDPMQKSNSTTFSDVPTAPKASIIETVNGFVMAFDTNDATFGDRPDGWWCSALRDQDNWTPSIATQAANGRLLDSPGAIRAGKRLGADIVAYKERSMYLGRYVNAPLIWEWALVPGDIGALSHEAVVNIGTAHIFPGYEDFYIFDGTRPVSIGAPVREWFLDNLDPSYRYRVKGMHDRVNATVWWWFPNLTAAGVTNTWLAYHYKKNSWGKGSLSIEAVAEYLSGAITYDTLGDHYATYDDLPMIAYDSPFWISQSAVPAIADTTHTIKSLTGDSVSCSLTTGDIGDDEQFSALLRLRPRFMVIPSAGTVTHKTRNILSNTLVSRETNTMNGGKFDLRAESRWHQLTTSFTGPTELTGFAVDIRAGGMR